MLPVSHSVSVNKVEGQEWDLKKCSYFQEAVYIKRKLYTLEWTNLFVRLKSQKFYQSLLVR